MTTTITKLLVNAESLLALGRLSHLNLASNTATRKLRADLPPGQHKGEATFKLVYDLTVGEDHEAEVAQTVPWKQLAGSLFARLNQITQAKVLREVLVRNDDGSMSFNDDERFTDREDELAELMGKTRKIVAGKITGSAVLLPID